MVVARVRTSKARSRPRVAELCCRYLTRQPSCCSGTVTDVSLGETLAASSCTPTRISVTSFSLECPLMTDTYSRITTKVDTTHPTSETFRRVSRMSTTDTETLNCYLSATSTWTSATSFLASCATGAFGVCICVLSFESMGCRRLLRVVVSIRGVLLLFTALILLIALALAHSTCTHPTLP
jgi:hypothetical protein